MGTQMISRAGLSLLFTTVLIATVASPIVVSAAVKAFPTAEGFGGDAIGGRGGRVIRVTNLNDSGPGSLRDALEVQTGPRIVIFNVGGTINLTKRIALSGENGSFVTIAGQTAPGGIQLKGPETGLTIGSGAHDVIVRHLRIRPGGPPPTNPNLGCPLIIYGNPRVNNVIIDHCSFQWATDDTVNLWAQFNNITIQWSILAEPIGLSPSFNSGMFNGGDAGSDQNTSSIHHNLFASCGVRNPKITRSAITDFRNNVIYNWGSNGAPTFNGSHALTDWGQTSPAYSVLGNLVNNLYLPGPNSQDAQMILANGSGERGGSKIYISGNWVPPNCSSGCANDWSIGFIDRDTNLVAASESKYRVSTPFSAPAVATDPTNLLKSKVLGSVGAHKPGRDSLDQRIIDNVNNFAGNIANIVNGGPWPTLGGQSAPVDSDNDGIPNYWETAHGLNPNDASDGNRVAANGYTNIENYLNELAGDAIPGEAPPPPDNLRITSSL